VKGFYQTVYYRQMFPQDGRGSEGRYSYN